MFEFIKNFFKPKEKGKVVKVLKVTPEILEKVDIALKKELGFKEAELQEAMETINTLKEKLGKYEGKETEEEKIVKDLLKEKTKIEKIKTGRRLKSYFPKMGRIVTHDNKLYTDGKQTYPFLCGFEKEETEYGWGYNLLLKSGNKKNDGRANYKLPLEMIFYEPEHLVSGIKYGIVRTRFDSRGLFHPPKFISSPCSKCNFSGEYYKSISSFDKKYGNKIAELNDQIDNLRAELKDARIREEGAQSRLKDAESAISVADFRADLSQGYTAAQLEKFKARESDYSELLLSSQDSEINRVLTQKLNERLIDGFKEMAKKLGVDIPESVEERIRNRVIENIRKDIDLFWDILPAKEERVKETKPIEKKKEIIKK